MRRAEWGSDLEVLIGRGLLHHLESLLVGWFMLRHPVPQMLSLWRRKTTSESRQISPKPPTRARADQPEEIGNWSHSLKFSPEAGRSKFKTKKIIPIGPGQTLWRGFAARTAGTRPPTLLPRLPRHSSRNGSCSSFRMRWKRKTSSNPLARSGNGKPHRIRSPGTENLIEGRFLSNHSMSGRLSPSAPPLPIGYEAMRAPSPAHSQSSLASYHDRNAHLRAASSTAVPSQAVFCQTIQPFQNSAPPR